MAAPLDGVVVVDFTEYVAGPYCTMMLADMGAEVLKVEPFEGDHWRRQQPVAGRESRYYIGVNRGKKSIAMRIETPEGRAVAHDLVRRADVVVTNYRPGLPEQLGLDYATLASLRPGLIYAALSAFGPEGPYSGRPGFDLLVQAMSGIMDFERKVERGVPVGITSFAPADLSTGMFTAYAIVAALFMRERTGLGQKIDTSLFASALAIQYRPTLAIESLDREARETMLGAVEAARDSGASYEDLLQFRTGLGLGRATAMYYRVFRTKDSMVCVACLNNRQRRGLRDALGVNDPAVDGHVYELGPAATPEDHLALAASYEEAFLARTTEEWLPILAAADVPCVPVVLTEEVFDHPQVAANGLIRSMEHPVVGTIRQPGCPVWMSNAEVGRDVPAPSFSADSRETLRWLGYGEEKIANLETEGVVQPPAAGPG
ncbi:MAG: CoA transferase [Thermoflexaceae bacterium]|nr:CoA transferase [Thermoflexaceae bacterium]